MLNKSEVTLAIRHAFWNVLLKCTLFSLLMYCWWKYTYNKWNKLKFCYVNIFFSFYKTVTLWPCKQQKAKFQLCCTTCHCCTWCLCAVLLNIQLSASLILLGVDFHHAALMVIPLWHIQVKSESYLEPCFLKNLQKTYFYSWACRGGPAYRRDVDIDVYYRYYIV